MSVLIYRVRNEKLGKFTIKHALASLSGVSLVATRLLRNHFHVQLTIFIAVFTQRPNFIGTRVWIEQTSE